MLLEKLAYSYLTPIVLLAVAIGAQAPRATATTLDHYSGWTGTVHDNVCANQTCNNSDGCSWVSDEYDTYYPKNNCNAANPPGSGSDCTQTMKLCRVITYYLGGGCAQPVDEIDRYHEGGC